MKTARAINKSINIFKSFIKYLVARKRKKFDDCLLLSSHNHAYSDNSKYFHDYLLDQGYNAYYVVNNFEYSQLACRQRGMVLYGSKSYYSALKTCASIFFTHSERDIGWYIPPKIVRVNLWHGSPIKKMGYDSSEDLKWLKKYHQLGVKTPYERWHYLVVASDLFKGAFMSALKYDDSKIIVSGLPRNSILEQEIFDGAAHKNLKSSLRQQLKIVEGRVVVLYAPTYRSGEFDIVQQCGLLKNLCAAHSDITLAIRLHPFDRSRIQQDFYSDQVINASVVDDVQRLLLVTDMLITDYSSIAFDFSVLGRPVYLYCPDREAYEAERGGFYFNIKELPFFYCESVDEINFNTPHLIASATAEMHKKNANNNLVEKLISVGVLSESSKNQ